LRIEIHSEIVISWESHGVRVSLNRGTCWSTGGSNVFLKSDRRDSGVRIGIRSSISSRAD
jgi:hypothetical protein